MHSHLPFPYPSLFLTIPAPSNFYTDINNFNNTPNDYDSGNFPVVSQRGAGRRIPQQHHHHYYQNQYRSNSPTFQSYHSFPFPSNFICGCPSICFPHKQQKPTAIPRTDPPVRLNRLHGANHSCTTSLSPDAYVLFENTATAYRTALLDHITFSLHIIDQREPPSSPTHQMLYRFNTRRRIIRGQGRNSEPTPSQVNDEPVSRRRGFRIDHNHKFTFLRGYGRQPPNRPAHWSTEQDGRNSFDVRVSNNSLPQLQSTLQPVPYQPFNSNRLTVLPDDRSSSNVSNQQNVKHKQFGYQRSQRRSLFQSSIAPRNASKRTVSLSPSDELIALREVLRAMDQPASYETLRTRKSAGGSNGRVISAPIGGRRTGGGGMEYMSSSFEMVPLQHIGRPDRTRTDDRNRPNHRTLSLRENVREAQMKSRAFEGGQLYGSDAVVLGRSELEVEMEMETDVDRITGDGMEVGRVEIEEAVMEVEEEEEVAMPLGAGRRRPGGASRYPSETDSNLSSEKSDVASGEAVSGTSSRRQRGSGMRWRKIS